jgi:WD40 repeat protein
MFGGAGVAVVAAAGGTTAALLLSGSNPPKPTPKPTATTFGSLGSYRGAVHTLAFSPDGKILVAGTDNHNVPLWDAATGALIGTLVGHTDKVPIVACSPDGKYIATSSDDSTVRIWDATTCKALNTLLVGNSTVALAFSPDSKTLATNATGIALWDVASGTETKSLDDRTNMGIGSVDYSPDGKLIAEGYSSGEVGVWSIATYGELGKVVVNSTSFPSQVTFSPDGKTIAVANILPRGTASGGVGSYINASVQLVDVAALAVKATLPGFTDAVNSVAFSPDGTVLAASGTDSKYKNTVQLFDVSTHRTTRVITSTTGQVNWVDYSPDGKLLAIASNAIQLVSV